MFYDTVRLGKVVDENGAGLPELQIQALAVNGLHGDAQLGVGTSDKDGIFAFPLRMVRPARLVSLGVRNGDRRSQRVR